jgi:TolB-like protein
VPPVKCLLLPLLAVFLLAAPRAEAQASAYVAPGLPTVAIFPLEANGEAQDAAPGISSLLASQLAEVPQLHVLAQWDVEATLRQKEPSVLVGAEPCADAACLEALTRATGARYIVTGRLDRFGDTYLLTANLTDTVLGRSLAKPRSEAASPGTLLPMAKAVGAQLVAELVSATKTYSSRPLFGSAHEPPGEGLVLGLRINNSFISKLEALNPGADVEVGYSFHPEWIAFVQIGLTFIRSNEEGREGRLKVVPSVLGARHYHRLEHAFRPYWGLGLGVQLSFGQFGIFESTGPLPTVMGFLGAEYLIAGKVGLNFELGTNLAQATLGLAGDGLGDGLNLDLTAGVAFHF